MAFNPLSALSAAKEATKIVDKGANIFNKLADGKTKRAETRKDGDTNRAIRVNHAQTEDWCTEIETGANVIMDALNTASDIFSKISGSVNVSRETSLKIEESRRKFELDKKKLDDELTKDLEKIHQDCKRYDNEHEEKMSQMEKWHEEEMARIAIVREAVITLLNFTMEIARQNPSDPNIGGYITSLNSSLNTLNMNNSVKYIEG